MKEDGTIDDYRLRWIALKDTYDDDPKIRALLERFYQKVAEDPAFRVALEPKLEQYALEKDSGNTYVGAKRCAECHAEISAGWKKTRHANAFNTLIKANRHFYANCVSCHVTGAGVKSGFQIDQSTKHLEGVQCEVCHGPGSRHARAEGQLKLRTEIPEALCVECHTVDTSPDFSDHFPELLAKVAHSEDEQKTAEGTTYSQIQALRKSDAALYAKLEQNLFCTCCKTHHLLHCDCGNAKKMKTYLNNLLLKERDYLSIVSKMIGKFGPETLHQKEEASAGNGMGSHM